MNWWSINLKHRNYLQVNDLSSAEVTAVLEFGRRLKLERHAGVPHPILRDKVLGMFFEKPSTRTRVSFEAGMTDLGGHAMYLDFKNLQTSRVESLEDTARIVSGYSDIIIARLFKHTDLETIAKYSRVPVINALTDKEHPCQALADVMTVMEHKGTRGVRLAYVGDAANNVAHSLMIACAKLGINVSVGCPEKHKPMEWAMTTFKEVSKRTGSTIEIFRTAEEAVRGADVVYTDVWVSMGDEKEEKERIGALKPFQVNKKLMAKAKPDAIFMHDLPAHRGFEVTDEVIDGPQSVVFDQGENRMYVQNALMCFLLKGT